MTPPAGREGPGKKETREINQGGPEDSDSTDSDFSDRGGRNMGDQKPVENSAEAKLAAEKLAAEKLATESNEKLVQKLAAANLAEEKQGAETPLGGQPTNLFPDSEEIGNRLRDLIKKDRKGLQKIYSGEESELEKILKDPIKNGVEMARQLIQEEKCSFEIAKDLTVLTLYDIAILIGMSWCQCPFLEDCLAYSWTD